MFRVAHSQVELRASMRAAARKASSCSQMGDAHNHSTCDSRGHQSVINKPVVSAVKAEHVPEAQQSAATCLSIAPACPSALPVPPRAGRRMLYASLRGVTPLAKFQALPHEAAHGHASYGLW
eukprot:6203095-Pleurochrysis_carterae.AAC.1